MPALVIGDDPEAKTSDCSRTNGATLAPSAAATRASTKAGRDLNRALLTFPWVE